MPTCKYGPDVKQATFKMWEIIKHLTTIFDVEIEIKCVGPSRYRFSK